MAVRAGCHFCEESIPFYQRLGELQAARKLRAQTLVVTPDDAAQTKDTPFWSAINLNSVFNEPLDRIQVSATPTVMLVDDRGQVKRSWAGKQSAEGEREIVDAASSRSGKYEWLSFRH